MSEQTPNEAVSFVLEQQAKQAVKMEQLTSKLEQLVDASLKSERRISEVESAVVAGINFVNTLNKSILELVETQKVAAGQMAELRTQAAATNARLDQMNARLDQTNEQLDETNERLNIFINVLERYISENRNGKHNNQ